MPSEAELAYAAGIVDGEGSISAAVSKRCPTNFRATVAVAMCDVQPALFMQRIFGGKVSVLKRRTKSGKPVYQWALYCRKAADALEQMLPYLLVKKNRAINAIELARMMKPRDQAMRPLLVVDQMRRLDIASLIKEENISGNARAKRYAS